jgi:septum site-determining protein MinD
MKSVIGIFSAKGGVGKTTLALNIALAIHNFNNEVLMLDCDFKNSNLALHLGLYDFPLTLQDVIETNVNFLEAVHVHSSGLRIVPASVSLREFKTDYDKLKGVLKEIKHCVVLDTPPGMENDVAALMKISDEIVVVTTPDIPAFTDSLKSIQLAKDYGKRIRGIIVNRAERKYELDVSDIEKISGIPILGVVPEDKNVKKSVYFHTPVVEFKPNSASSVAIKKIAADLIGKDYRPPRFLGLRRLFA